MKKKKIISICLLSIACLSVTSIKYFSGVEAFDGVSVAGPQSTDDKAASVIKQAETLVINHDIEGMKALLAGEVKEIESDTTYVPSEELMNAVQAMFALIEEADANSGAGNDATFEDASEQGDSDEATEDNPFGEQ
jgi:hypothetical protein